MSIADPDPRHSLRVAWTGKGATERLLTLPISPKPGDGSEVALSLGKARNPEAALPELKPGDRLQILAELAVTTDLTAQQAEVNARDGGQPAGVPYDFSPAVVARLFLAPTKDSVSKRDGSIEIGQRQRIKLGHDQHHAVFVFDEGAGIDLLDGMPPWKGPCFVNLALSASHRDAQPGNVLLVGQNEFDGTVKGDMGGIACMRLRPGSQSEPRARRSRKRLTRELPLQGGVKKVIYSLRLEDLRAGEQLRIRSDVRASAVGLGYAARLSTRAFLADSPTQVAPSGKGYAASLASAGGQISKANGFNMTRRSPSMTYTKVGVLRILEDADRPLFVNVVGVAGDPEKKGRNDSAAIDQGGQLRVVRFAPELLG